MKFDYDKEQDVLYIYSPKEKVSESLEIADDIILDINEKNQIVGIEIFYASKFLNAINKKINQQMLENLQEAKMKIINYRNNFAIITIFLKYGNKLIEHQLSLQTSHFESPLVATA